MITYPCSIWYCCRSRYTDPKSQSDLVRLSIPLFASLESIDRHVGVCDFFYSTRLTHFCKEYSLCQANNYISVSHRVHASHLCSLRLHLRWSANVVLAGKTDRKHPRSGSEVTKTEPWVALYRIVALKQFICFRPFPVFHFWYWRRRSKRGKVHSWGIHGCGRTWVFVNLILIYVVIFAACLRNMTVEESKKQQWWVCVFKDLDVCFWDVGNYLVGFSFVFYTKVSAVLLVSILRSAPVVYII